MLSKHYLNLLNNYENYLLTLGYSSKTCYYNFRLLKEYFHYLEDQKIVRVTKTTKNINSDYIDYLASRKNQRRGGKISNVHLNAYIRTLKQFADYYQKTYEVIIPMQHLRFTKVVTKEKEVLTVEEVKELFNVTKDHHRIGYRDRAMLAVYYSCGLRRNEAVHLELNDIDYHGKVLYVRKGKGNKERYVPLTDTSITYLKEYVRFGRPMLINKEKRIRKLLFISERGTAIQSQSLYIRLKRLQLLSNLESLKDKSIGLHTLRHSIATHLLQNNMRLEDISRFLGHSSMESTQIYTHIDENEIF